MGFGNLSPRGKPLGAELQFGDVLRVSMLALAIVVGALVAARILGSDAAPESRRLQWILVAAAEAFGLLSAIYFVFVRGRGMRFAELGYVAAEPRMAMAGVAAGFVALPLAYAIFFLIRPIFGSETNVDVRRVMGGGDIGLIQAGTILLYVGFLVPIAEELFFRGILFRWLRQHFSFWPAALISSAIFGAAHFRAETMIIVGMLGVAMAWLYERSGSLVPAILMHQTYNSLTMMMTFAFIWSRGAGQG
jgi:hypothetical protein